MRKLVQMLLAAGALLPAPVLAQDGEPGMRRGGEWRPARDRGVRPDGGQPAARADVAPRSGGERRWNGGNDTPGPSGVARENRPGWSGRDDTPRPPVVAGDDRRQWDRRGDAPRPPAAGRDDRQRWDGRGDVPRPPVVARDDGRRWNGRDDVPRPPVVARDDRQRWNGRDDDRRRSGWGDGRRDDRSDWNDRRGFGGWNDRDRGGWNRDWRQDRRYDWNGWRDRNRSAYRLPRYYAPYGWNGGYRRFGIGVRLSQPLFAQDYWIGDPWGYRLPPADGPYRWVRYFNDAMLVDLRYGTVVDVVYDIFY